MLDKISSNSNDLNANANPFALDTAGDSRWNDAFISRQPRIRLVSSSSSGELGERASTFPDITPKGQFVAFKSEASTLVPNDTNGVADIFVKDVRTGKTTRVSVASDGTQANQVSTDASISRNGRYVVFASNADNLVPDDTNGKSDIFLHDTKQGTTTRLSVDSNGNQGNDSSRTPYISENGHYVTFTSNATNLGANDQNGSRDSSFVRDLQTGNIKRLPLRDPPSLGEEAKGISADGRYVLSSARFFTTGRNIATKLFLFDQHTETATEIPSDILKVAESSISSDGRFVAFNARTSLSDPTPINPVNLYERETGITKSLSLSENTNPSVKYAGLSLSGDGRYLAFSSNDNQVVPGDTNSSFDVFVYDTSNETSKRLSVNAQGIQGNANSFNPSFSADGRFVSFQSDASNLVANDTNNDTDVFWVRNYSA